MITVTTGAEMRRRAAAFRAAGLRIGFVPTMGALHAGHLALVARARELGGRVVASVFVNPAQFDDPADLERYPRQPEEDARLLAAAGVDVLFLPPVAEVYPPGDATAVVVRGPAEGLEGALRPGHFQGVATVLARLFHLVAPDTAVFGEKDAQQLAVVRRMVADLHFPVEIVAHPTVREEDGLALSSRNARLDPAARRAATVLFRALAAGREAVEAAFRAAGGEAVGGPERAVAGAHVGAAAEAAASAAVAAAAPPVRFAGSTAPAPPPLADLDPDGVAPAAHVRAAMRRVLAEEPAADLDYAEVVDAVTFQPLDRLPARGRVVLPLAVRLGGVRLIDNLQLDLPPAPAAGRPLPAARETSPAALS